MFFTINRKKTKVVRENGKIKIDEKEIHPTGSFILPATLKKECAYVVVETSNKTYYLKSVSWLEKENDTSDDHQLVEDLNNEIKDLFQDTMLSTETFEALVSGKFEAYDIYSFKNALYAPEHGWKLSLNNLDVVFFERLTSYTKTFDITLIYKDKKMVHLSNIYRKQYLDQVELLLKDETVYKTGPDPVDWDDAKTKHYDNGVAWEHVIDDESAKEDSEEEWVAGETDEEESDDWDVSDIEEDEEVPSMSLHAKRKLDDEWDAKSKVLHSEDYDRYEKRSRT